MENIISIDGLKLDVISVDIESNEKYIDNYDEKKFDHVDNFWKIFAISYDDEVVEEIYNIFLNNAKTIVSYKGTIAEGYLRTIMYDERDNGSYELTILFMRTL